MKKIKMCYVHVSTPHKECNNYVLIKNKSLQFKKKKNNIKLHTEQYGAEHSHNGSVKKHFTETTALTLSKVKTAKTPRDF